MNFIGKSVTVHHQDGTAMMDIGVASDDLDGSPLPSPANHHMSLAEQIRRKRETAFDIDNIVIPYRYVVHTKSDFWSRMLKSKLFLIF